MTRGDAPVGVPGAGGPPTPVGVPGAGGPTPGLARGHAFDAFDLSTVEVPGADWAIDMAVTPLVVNSSGVLQGGLLTTLVDLVAGTALLRGDGAHQRGTTTELHVSFLAPARTGPVRAAAHVLRRGRRNAVVRVEVHDRGADDLHVATATLTFAVRPGAGDPRMETGGSERV